MVASVQDLRNLFVSRCNQLSRARFGRTRACVSTMFYLSSGTVAGASGEDGAPDRERKGDDGGGLPAAGAGEAGAVVVVVVAAPDDSSLRSRAPAGGDLGRSAPITAPSAV